MTASLKLISHKLCPYVQRAVIALKEEGRPVRADRHRSRQQARLVPEAFAAR
ncbi:glutathione S-transferase [Bradyrhizobium betae]|nr:glutathione S-transferase [Bradyrhizobium betae]